MSENNLSCFHLYAIDLAGIEDIRMVFSIAVIPGSKLMLGRGASLTCP